ncbi:hypothetical protein GFY24_39225 [Nocardia sp. SYP-A9097]|uniref:hypothetical protein n=1 Tax=Nocardia sp. SYP-A9097 TaxID=2663237 RepID=UPI00129B3854|nr:hypothetical protein [Nocardia sp. SYP-A9097]MRH93383.1 hypothetical protein [Nocardia sp. SYP-A9097]
MEWVRKLLRRGGTTELDPGRGDLIVVVSSFDDAEACSAALARAEHWTPDQPAVLRHHLRVPADQIRSVAVIAAQEGYELSNSPGEENMILRRVQILDALHCSQERSRMAGLAQRHDGDALGWDALQPAMGQPKEKK